MLRFLDGARRAFRIASSVGDNLTARFCTPYRLVELVSVFDSGLSRGSRSSGQTQLGIIAVVIYCSALEFFFVRFKSEGSQGEEAPCYECRLYVNFSASFGKDCSISSLRLGFTIFSSCLHIEPGYSKASATV